VDEQLAAGADARRMLAAEMDRLYAEINPRLWQAARSAGLSQQDAEDVLGTAWEKLVSHWETIRDPEAVTAWLFKTTLREAWKVAANRRKTRPADDEWLTSIPDPRENLEERVMLDEEQREIWAALRTLPPLCQRLLRIVAFEPRPDYDKLATRLSMKRGSIGPTRRRCLESLRVALAARGGGR
jgi:RNA polymerase sigma factor (sigma-70 family)